MCGVRTIPQEACRRRDTVGRYPVIRRLPTGPPARRGRRPRCTPTAGVRRLTSARRSVWRRDPVLASKRAMCVLTVVRAMLSEAAASGIPHPTPAAREAAPRPASARRLRRPRRGRRFDTSAPSRRKPRPRPSARFPCARCPAPAAAHGPSRPPRYHRRAPCRCRPQPIRYRWHAALATTRSRRARSRYSPARKRPRTDGNGPPDWNMRRAARLA